MLGILLAPRTRIALFALWCLLWAWVAYMSLTSIQLPPGAPSDKVLHFTGYMLMSAGVAGFCHEPRRIVLWALRRPRSVAGSRWRRGSRPTATRSGWTSPRMRPGRASAACSRWCG